MTTISRNPLREPICPMMKSRILNPSEGAQRNSALEELLWQNRKRWHPLLYHLVDVEWKIFGTLTWDGYKVRQATDWAQWQRDQDFKRLLFLSRVQLGLRKRSFNSYHALEWGAAGECHFHFLLTKKGLELVAPEQVARTLTEVWGTKIGGAGKAVIKPFNEARHFDGVSYCLKREYNESGQERERFDSISDGLERMLLKKVSQGTEPAPNHDFLPCGL